MLNEITKVNFDTIREAAQNGENITIIINGQFYDLDTEAPAGIDPKAAFIEGVKFAAAVIEDARARSNCVFEGMRTIKRISKAATEANRTRNEETRGNIRLLNYLLQYGFEARKNEYIEGTLWKLPDND